MCKNYSFCTANVTYSCASSRSKRYLSSSIDHIVDTLSPQHNEPTTNYYLCLKSKYYYYGSQAYHINAPCQDAASAKPLTYSP